MAPKEQLQMAPKAKQIRKAKKIKRCANEFTIWRALFGKRTWKMQENAAAVKRHRAAKTIAARAVFSEK